MKAASALVLGLLFLPVAASGCSDDPPSPAQLTTPPRAEKAAANRAGIATSGATAEAVPTDPAALPGGAPIAAPPAPPGAPAVADPAAQPGWTPLDTLLAKTLRRPAKHRAELAEATRYDLDVDVDVDLMTYGGSEKVRFTNRTGRALDSLVFLVYPNSPELVHGSTKNLVVTKVAVDGAPGTARLDGATLIVELGQLLHEGKSVEVAMDFKGRIYRLPRDTGDLTKIGLQQLLQLVTGEQDHEGGYGVFGHSDGVISLGLWYPILVAHDGQGWDLKPGGTMGDVSHFSVSHVEASISAPAGVEVVASGVEVERTVKGDRVTRRVWAGGVRELTVQLSSDYEVATTQAGDVAVQSWFKKGHRDAGEKVLRYGAEALRVFEKEHGPYPYTELDLAEAPLIGGAGGVEFPGLVTIATMLYGSPTVDVSGSPLGKMLAGRDLLGETLEFVVAHEVAHQWWNAVVGSDSKRHPFIDEALANFSAVRYFELTHGGEAADRQRTMQLKVPLQLALATGAKDRPVDLPTDAFTNTMEYSAIVYGKGALFFEALRDAMGASAFDSALRGYYERFSFRLAQPKDLLGAFEAAAGARRGEVTRLAERWLHGAHASEDVGGLDVMGLLGAVLPQDTLAGSGVDLNGLMGLLDPDGLGGTAKDIMGLMDRLGDADSFPELLSGLLDPETPLGLRLNERLGDLLGLDDGAKRQVDKMLRGFKRFAERGDGAGMEDGVLDVLKEMVDDPRMKQLMDGTGALLELLKEPEPQQP